VLLCGAILAFAVVGDPVEDRRAIYAAVGISLVSWVVVIRPVVSIPANGVLLRNMVRDAFVPWSKIERCRAVQTLQVVTEETRFHGLGVNRSARSMVRQRYGRTSMTFRPPSLMSLGLGGAIAGSSPSTAAPHSGSGDARTGIAYEDYVEIRIRDLARDAKPDALVPVVAWVWQSAAALGLAAVLLVLLFV